jgi:signal transduction histidine kinase
MATAQGPCGPAFCLDLAAVLARLTAHGAPSLENAPEAIDALEQCAAELKRLVADTEEDDAGSTLELVSHLLSEVAVVAERSRRRLARLALDLHDVALQEIAALRTQVHAARTGIGDADREHATIDVVALADDVGDRLRKLDRELRELLHSFKPPSLVEGKFEDIVRDLVREYSRDTGIAVTTSVSGDTSRLTRSQRIALFRVLTEALTNAGRPARADHVSVSVYVQKKQARLRVRDNGKGFDAQRIAARAAEARAVRARRDGRACPAPRRRLDVASQRGGPTTITAVVPAGRVEELRPRAGGRSVTSARRRGSSQGEAR